MNLGVEQRLKMLGIVAILLDPFVLIGFILGSLYFYLTATFDFWKCRGVPFKKPTVLLGNFGPLLLFRRSQPEGVKEMYQWFKDERFFGAFRVRSPVLILRDPDLVRSVCVKDFACFSNRGIPVNNDQVHLSISLLFRFEIARYLPKHTRVLATNFQSYFNRACIY